MEEHQRDGEKGNPNIAYLGCNKCLCTRKLSWSGIRCCKCGDKLFGTVREMGWIQRIPPRTLIAGSKCYFFCNNCKED